jgi:uncharacterized protein
MTDEPRHFLLQLHGTRPDWPEGMSEEESRIMGEHFLYLKALTEQGSCLLAGPVFPHAGEPAIGLIVLECEDEAAARRLAEGDPSVREGLHSFTLRPMRASLLKGRSN